MPWIWEEKGRGVVGQRGGRVKASEYSIYIYTENSQKIF